MINTINFLKEQIEYKILTNDGLSKEELKLLKYNLHTVVGLLDTYEKDSQYVKNKIMDKIENEAWDHGKPGN
jgi:hypothetical protein